MAMTPATARHLDSRPSGSTAIAMLENAATRKYPSRIVKPPSDERIDPAVTQCATESTAARAKQGAAAPRPRTSES